MTENQIDDLMAKADLLETNGDYIGAYKNRADAMYPNATDAEKSAYIASNIIADMSNIATSESQLNQLVTDINNGVYDEASVQKIKEAYSSLAESVVNGFKHEDGTAMTRSEAEEVYNSLHTELLTDKAKANIDTVYKNKYNTEVTSKNGVVNVNADGWEKQFGNFVGSNNSKSNQSLLVSDIKKMVTGEKATNKNRSLEVGDIILVNYGTGLGMNAAWKYNGNGEFVKVTSKEAESASFAGKLVVPEGYIYDNYGHVYYNP